MSALDVLPGKLELSDTAAAIQCRPGLARPLRSTYNEPPAGGDGDLMSKKKYVETEAAREKRLGENTEEKIAARQNESDALDERVRENIRQHGA